MGLLATVINGLALQDALEKRGVTTRLMSAVEVRQIPAFQIWCDPSYGPYLWETLLEIVREKGGGPVGMSSVFPELGK